MATFGLGHDPRVHLRQRFRWAIVGEAAEDIVGIGLREGGYGPEQHSPALVLDHESRASAQPKALRTTLGRMT